MKTHDDDGFVPDDALRDANAATATRAAKLGRMTMMTKSGKLLIVPLAPKPLPPPPMTTTDIMHSSVAAAVAEPLAIIEQQKLELDIKDQKISDLSHLASDVSYGRGDWRHKATKFHRKYGIDHAWRLHVEAWLTANGLISELPPVPAGIFKQRPLRVGNKPRKVKP